VKDFLYYVSNKSVKKQLPDINTARATAKDCFDRITMAKNILNAEKPKYVLENAYESIRELIDAILFLEGYKSYSHEASVAYLLILGFSITETMTVDRLRIIRNGIKYYGEDATKQDAEQAIKTAEKVISKLLKMKKELKPEA